jgi:hypothetical protein
LYSTSVPTNLPSQLPSQLEQQQQQQKHYIKMEEENENAGGRYESNSPEAPDSAHDSSNSASEDPSLSSTTLTTVKTEGTAETCGDASDITAKGGRRKSTSGEPGERRFICTFPSCTASFFQVCAVRSCYDCCEV